MVKRDGEEIEVGVLNPHPKFMKIVQFGKLVGAKFFLLRSKSKSQIW